MTFTTQFAQRLLATTATLALTAAPAWAQVDDNLEGDLAATPVVEPGEQVDLVPGDEIIVTGIRASIAESLQLKRENTSIVEAISAEDIGKLPDVSIADSLARLPGVTAQRVRGRAQQISIRGLGPDFSLALLNGREIVSAGNNRGIEFDQFPSELIGSAVVYKSPDARLAATGLAGTVDLRTVKPLDFTEDQVNLSAKYVINDNGQLNPDFPDDGYRLFGSYIAVNDSQTTGIALAVTTQSNPTQFFSRELKTNQFQVARTPGGGASFYAADNPRTGVVSRDFKRTSIAGALQFEPNDAFRASADVLFSDYSDEGIFRGVETPLASWSGNSLTSFSGSNAFVDTATYGQTPVILRTDTESNEVEQYSFGMNLQYDLTERLTLEADFATSGLDRNDIDYESYAGLGRGIVGSGDTSVLSELTYTTPYGGEYSIADGRNLNYTDASSVLLTDPGGWGQVGFVREPIVEDDLDQIRLEASYDVGFDMLGDLKLGAIFTDREKNFDDKPRFVRPGQGFVNSSQAIPADSIVGVTDTGSIGFPIIAYDPSDFVASGIYVLEETPGTIYSIDEGIDTYYAMLEIDSDLGAIPVTGNIGLQYVDVDQGSIGRQSSPTGSEFVEVTDSYDYFLPSVNLGFEVTPETVLRAAFAKTATRPRLNDIAGSRNLTFNPQVCQDTDGDGIPDQIAPGQTVSAPNNLCFSLGGGNPLLRPYRSDSYDLSLEHYFGATSAIAIAGFYKDLSDYVLGSTDFVDGSDIIRGFGAGGLLAANPAVGTISVGGPVNLAEGKIQGIEVTLRLAAEDFLDYGFLDGFGLNFTYGYSDAEVEFEDIVIDIPGYSEETASGEVYYENYGFRARVNARYRDDSLSEVFAFDGTAVAAQALDELLVDAQVGYEFQDGPLQGVSFNVEAYNLTDEPFRTENDLDGVNGPVGTFVSRREDYGRTFNFTVAAKF